MKNIIAIAFLFSFPLLGPPADLTAADAKNHIGESATVCGIVASTKYADRSRKQPTFLNLDEPYPRHIFTAVIFGDDRPKFDAPEIKLKGKKICVSGKIEDYKGKPEIILRDPDQLKIQ